MHHAKRNGFRFSVDCAFPQVILGCAKAPRPDQSGTWITPEIIHAYKQLHQLGIAHSVEAWDQENKLVGGIYGVETHGAFAAESMFHLKSNASKLCLLHLIRYLQSRGLEWMDIQVITPHMEALGARLIPRDEFLALLARTQTLGLRLFS